MLVAPATGVVLSQPADPALLRWTPVAGATSYTVEVSKDPNFTDPVLTKSYGNLKTTAHVVPDPQVANLYYWRVRATLGTGIFTDWSEVRTYQIGGLSKPVLTSPVNSPETDVVDVVLDWEPVLGAKTYDIQISTDINFNTFDSAASFSGVTGTRYSPRRTLGNDQYYWRVRPVDANGNQLDWSAVDVWTFRRHWPDQPSLEYPVGGATVGSLPYFQWTAVPHASSYNLQLSNSPEFNPGDIFDQCSTTNTTFVPMTTNDCFPFAGSGYWWRVIAVDAEKNVVTDGILSERGRFTYDPARPVQLAPADGASVEIPVLRWQPVAGAESYRVTLTAVATGAVVGTVTTHATSFSPRTALTPGATYRWMVQTVSNGRIGTGLIPSAQPTFTVEAMSGPTMPTPEPLGPAADSESARFPTLTWGRVEGASRYRVWVRAEGDVGFTALNEYFAYPSGEDSGTTYLSSGTYEWFVEAYAGSALLAESSSTSTFRIASLPAVGGHRLALRGTSLENPQTSCGVALPARCEDLRQTPVLRWDAIPGAGYYNVFLSNDAAMTNIVTGYPKRADTSTFTPANSLIDSQAGQAFYWFVQPCKAGAGQSGKCSALAHAGHAFNKLSNPVELTGPSSDAAVANEVTFTWRDYLATNSDAKAGTTDSTGVNPRVEARNYRIQVSTDPNFQSNLEGDTVVDQTTYTAFAATYPEGPLYWRVQAIDGSGNPLTWSATGSFTKQSPTPTLEAPLDNALIARTEPLEWQPLPYAASYDVQVYKNADTTGSSANLVASGNVRQVAFTIPSPLAPSTTPYTWRVRRVDAKNRPGPWSDLGSPSARFRIGSAAPAVASPANGVYVSPVDGLFRWTAVDSAANYVFERRLANATSSTERVTTASLAWAPTTRLADGVWEWRVTALNAAGSAMGSSAWGWFRVDSTRPRVISRTPGAYASITTNFTVKFSEPVTGVSWRTMRLYVDGRQTMLGARVTVSADRRTAVLNPNWNLVRGKSYTLRVDGAIRDNAGLLLTPFWFRTRAR
jgi:hypothetical protein